eukprot:1775752-Amphidinium_carterae.1
MGSPSAHLGGFMFFFSASKASMRAGCAAFIREVWKAPPVFRILAYASRARFPMSANQGTNGTHCNSKLAKLLAKQ